MYLFLLSVNLIYVCNNNEKVVKNMLKNYSLFIVFIEPNQL